MQWNQQLQVIYYVPHDFVTPSGICFFMLWNWDLVPPNGFGCICILEAVKALVLVCEDFQKNKNKKHTTVCENFGRLAEQY